MRFGFDTDQEAFRDTTRALLDERCTPAAVRAAWGDAPGELDRSTWAALAEMGATSVLAPEATGGLGLDATWLVLLLEEAGRCALPYPFVETAAVAAPLVPERVVGGQVLATDLGGPYVPYASDADAFLLRADDGGLVVVDRSDVKVTPVTTVDGGLRAGTVDGAGRGEAVCGPDGAEAAFDRGALGVAAVLVGLAERMLAMTVEYVTSRQQFGVAVGSFQAVKHHLADAALRLQFARPLVRRAAWSLATGAPTAASDVSAAKALATEAAAVAGRKALQCHGAIGYTVEHDLHLFMKRAWALQASWGSAAWHRRRIGDALGLA